MHGQRTRKKLDHASFPAHLTVLSHSTAFVPPLHSLAMPPTPTPPHWATHPLPLREKDSRPMEDHSDAGAVMAGTGAALGAQCRPSRAPIIVRKE